MCKGRKQHTHTHTHIKYAYYSAAMNAMKALSDKRQALSKLLNKNIIFLLFFTKFLLTKKEKKNIIYYKKATNILCCNEHSLPTHPTIVIIIIAVINQSITQLLYALPFRYYIFFITYHTIFIKTNLSFFPLFVASIFNLKKKEKTKQKIIDHKQKKARKKQRNISCYK